MKAGWVLSSIGEQCVIRPPKSEARTSLRDKDAVSFVPMEQLGIRKKRLVLTDDCPLGEVYSGYTYFADNDVLLAKITPCFENGKLGIARNLTNGVGFGSSEFIVMRCGEGLLPEYLFYFLSQEYFTRQGAAKMTGAVGHKRVPAEFIENYPLPVPPLTEQKRIVAILDDAFAAIETAIVNTERNLENAHSLFDCQLSSVIASHAKHYPSVALGDVCTLYQGLAINKETKRLLVPHSSLPLLRIKDLREGTVEQYVAGSGYPENALVQKHDLIYTRTGQIGLVFRGWYGVLHNNCFKIVPTEEVERDYLYWWLQNPKFRETITNLASRAAQPDITHALFKCQPIAIPPINIQLKVAELFEAFHEAKQKLSGSARSKVVKLSELKNALLHKAFIGELTANPKTVEHELVGAGI